MMSLIQCLISLLIITCQASTPIHRLPLKFHNQYYSEEIWLHMLTPATNLRIFYEEGVSNVLLKVDENLIYPELTMTYYKHLTDSGSDSGRVTQKTIADYPIRFRQWTHIAVVVGDNIVDDNDNNHDEKLGCWLYLNGIASTRCSGEVKLSEVFKVDLCS